ncbi:MAG: hypothetical protein QXQ70_07930 [Candidatus Caldarchaeum sp.]
MSRTSLSDTLLIAVLALGILPYFILDSRSLFFHYTLVYVYLVLLAMAWNNLYSSMGMVSLGLQLYFGVSAYTTAYLINELNNMILAAVSGFLAGVILSVLVSSLLIKLKGLSFTIGSWMFAEGASLVMLNVRGLGGSQGYGIPTVQVPVKELYLAALVLVVLYFYGFLLFMKSRVGLGARGIK